jgi:hypothetical protein
MALMVPRTAYSRGLRVLGVALVLAPLLTPFASPGSRGVREAFAGPKGSASAPAPITASDVETAEQLYARLDYENANAVAERATKQKGTSRDRMVRAYRILAVSHAVLGREDAAKEAFITLLAIDPEYQVDPNLGPRVSGPFQEARGFWRAQGQKPGIEATATLRAGEKGILKVVVRDPGRLSAKVSVGYRWGAGAGEFTVQPVKGQEGSITLPEPPAGVTRLDYYVQATDERENVLLEKGSPAVPQSAFVEAAKAPPPKEKSGGSVFSSPIFWAIAGTVVLAGAGTAGYFIFRDDTPTSATLNPRLRCGAELCF